MHTYKKRLLLTLLALLTVVVSGYASAKLNLFTPLTNLVSKVGQAVVQVGDTVGNVFDQVLGKKNVVSTVVRGTTGIAGGGVQTVAKVTETIGNGAVNTTLAVTGAVVNTGLSLTGAALNEFNNVLHATGVSSAMANLLNVPNMLLFANRYGQYAVPGEVLVQFKPNVLTNVYTAIIAPFGVKVQRVVTASNKREDGQGDLVLFNASGKGLVGVLQRVLSLPMVLFAEPNWKMQMYTQPNDPFYMDGSTWGLYDESIPNSGGKTSTYGIGLSKVFQSGKKCDPNVYVAVIDSGIMVEHPDLKSNIWVNPDEVPNDHIDNDHNGYVDDVHGFNFVNRNGNVYTNYKDDVHGTHVAGTIAAVADNNIGVAGVCPKAKIISAKIFGEDGADVADVIEAIDYVIQLKRTKKINIVAINASFGGPIPSFHTLSAIRRAKDAGILFVAAAGNGLPIVGLGWSNDLLIGASYPGAFNTPNMITVGAINPQGLLTLFSNYGLFNVDIAAPGKDILSTVPEKNDQPGYKHMSGTSMAAPHVTGAVAYFASQYPNHNFSQIRSGVLNRSRHLPWMIQIQRQRVLYVGDY